MSKFSGYASKSEADYAKHEKERVENFMGGNSYILNPLLTLESIAASSIFGERSYYKTSGIKEARGKKSGEIKEEPKSLTSTTETFIAACDKALDYDFKGTLELAKTLRSEYLMRLNPALIAVRAAMHPNRAEFNKENKDFMKECIKSIINIPTDIWNQFELWMFFNSSKNKLPSILKRTWAEKLASTRRYQLAKYKNTARIIDLVRICHASSNSINELMKNGTIEITEEETTWETLRSQKKTWKEILETTYVPHMALLRNLRGIFSELNDESVNYDLSRQVLDNLEAGVEKGKQFPFRYWTARREIENCRSLPFKGAILDSLNKCIDLAMQNFPKLKGKTICLSDNSGSAWGTFNSEYGSVTVAEIDNLSSVMTAYNSDSGQIGIFGDKLGVVDINKRDGILTQTDLAIKKYGRPSRNYVGGSTENGIWIFFRDAIENKTFYDNIFIYSDMQAGHGGLYGLNGSEYKNYIHRNSEYGTNYIDVLKLVQDYRKKVNPKVNVFSIQTAGYNNNVLPENEYRVSILQGWTGKEAIYAKAMIDIWNKMDGISEESQEKSKNLTSKIKTFVK